MQDTAATAQESRDDARVDAMLRGIANRERAELRGEPVDVHAISETTVERLSAEARIAAQDTLGTLDPSPGALDDLGERILERAILVAACRTLAGAPLFASVAEVEALDANDVATLLDAFGRAARRGGFVRDDDDNDRATMDAVQRVARARHIDHLRAQHAAEIVAFYGLPCAREASVVQVLYFVACLRGSS